MSEAYKDYNNFVVGSPVLALPITKVCNVQIGAQNVTFDVRFKTTFNNKKVMYFRVRHYVVNVCVL